MCAFQQTCDTAIFVEIFSCHTMAKVGVTWIAFLKIINKYLRCLISVCVNTQQGVNNCFINRKLRLVFRSWLYNLLYDQDIKCAWGCYTTFWLSSEKKLRKESWQRRRETRVDTKVHLTKYHSALAFFRCCPCSHIFCPYKWTPSCLMRLCKSLPW